MRQELLVHTENLEFAIFDILRKLNLPLGDHAIFGSGPLAIRGIISSVGDLDVICRRDTWDLVKTLGKVEYLSEYDVHVVTMDNGALTFGTRWGIGDFDVDQLIDTAEVIQGLPFVRLEHVMRYKQIRGSDKDLMHLQALREKSGLDLL